MRWHQCVERGSFRGWLHGREWRRLLFKTEISWRSRNCVVELGFDQEDGHVTLTWAVPCLFMHFGFPWPRKWLPVGGRYGGDINVVRIAIHGGAIWWQLWRDDMGWSSNIPKWRDGNFNPADFLFGRPKYSTVEVEAQPITIDMPERAYAGTAKLLRATWRRPRAWWATTIMRAEIDVPGGVPFPGKGENSWDCGQDATFSMTTAANSIAEGVEQFRESVTRYRRRHGGADWRPEERENAS